MICIFDELCTDFSTNGLGPLSPTSLTIYEALNGRWEIRMEHPIDDWGKWLRLKQGRILRVPVPAGATPRVEMANITAGAEIWKVNTGGGRLRLRSGTSTGSRVLGSYENGTEVIVLDTTNADWYEVTTPDGKHGYMYADYLAYVRTESGSTAIEGIIESRPLRDQPFRIYRMVPTLKGFTVYARHLFYDLLDNMIVFFAPAKTTSGASVFSALGAACKEEHEFNFYSDLTSTAEDFEISNTNPVDAILGENGAAARYGGELARDWMDIYLVECIGSDRGVQIREGKNLTAIEYDEDITNVATRIMPTGTDADGNILYLPELYIDSENIGAYANPKWLHLPVDEAKESTSGDEKRSKEECYELMRAAAREKLDAGCDLPDVTLKIDFVNLADTEEYANFAILQTICMGDTVYVISRTLGKYVGIRLVESEYDGLKEKYTKMTLGSRAATIADSRISARQIASGSIAGGKLAIHSVGSSQIQPGSVGSMQIGMAAINIAHISVAAIKQLNAEAITATRAHINELVAGNITTDQLYADLAIIAAAQITAANIDKANINWAEIASLTAQIASIAKAQITTATIKEANISWAEIDTLNAQIASIAQAKIDNIEINSADIADLEATVAKIFSANINSADIGFAQIKDLVTNQAIITEGVGGQLYIARLAVTEANMVSLSVGELMIKGDDGRFYALGVDDEGNVTTTVKLVVNDDVADNTIHGTDKLIEGSITAQVLNVQNIFGDSAIIRQLIADNLDVARLFAREATIAALNAVDIRGNEYLQLSVGSVATAASNAQAAANNALNKATANTTIISRHETEIKQLSDQIDLRVTTSVYEQTTSDLRGEISGASTAASNAQSTANAASNAASNAQSTANAASNAASNAQSAADNAQTTADNAQSAANAAQNTADSNAKLLVEQQAQITLLDNQISSKVSRTELEEVQAEAASKSVIHYGDNPPADAGPNDIFVQNGTGIKYKPYAGDGLLPEFYLDDDGYLYYSYAAGQTVYNLMVDDDGRLCIDGDPSFAILIGDDGIPVVWEKITDSELESAIAGNKANLENLSNETDERINTAYSEMTQRIDEFEFVIAEKVGREEQRVYMRFDSDGVLELGKQGDRYVTQTSNSGFAVLQDGAAMATIERNTVSAPVIEARRQFALGGFAIRLGANGELLIM